MNKKMKHRIISNCEKCSKIENNSFLGEHNMADRPIFYKMSKDLVLRRQHLDRNRKHERELTESHLLPRQERIAKGGNEWKRIWGKEQESVTARELGGTRTLFGFYSTCHTKVLRGGEMRSHFQKIFLAALW